MLNQKFICSPLLLLMEGILHQLIGSLSYDLQGFIHPRWCRISSINSMKPSSSANHTPASAVLCGPPSRRRPGRFWDHARSSKTKIPGKNPKTKNCKPPNHPKSVILNKHPQQLGETKPPTCFFHPLLPPRSNITTSHPSGCPSHFSPTSVFSNPPVTNFRARRQSPAG